MQTMDEGTWKEGSLLAGEMFAVRRGTPYTEAERRYSLMVEKRLEDLLEAGCRQVVLMRRRHGHGGRTTVLAAPDGVNRADLRPEVVERILSSTLGFVRNGAPGGPIFQHEADGFLVENQLYSTRYPHIVIERVDVYERDHSPVCTEWRLRRTQNQKAETQINRWLDAAGLGLSILKSFRGGG